MTTRWIVLGALLMLLLAACSGGVSEDDAEEALRSIFEGNIDEASDSFCEETRGNIVESASLPEGVTLDEVDCEREGESMVCTSTFSVGAGISLDNGAVSDADADEPAVTEIESGDAESGDVGMSEEGTNVGESQEDPVSAQDDQSNAEDEAAEEEAEAVIEGDATQQEIVTRFDIEDGDLCGYRIE